MKVFSTKLVDGDHSGVSACLPDVYIEISVYSTVNCVSRPLSVTAAEMQRQENILPWCFLQFYYTFTEMCSFRLWGSYCELHVYKLTDSWYVLAQHPITWLCSESHTALAWMLEPPEELLKILILGPHPGPSSLGISVERGPGINIFLRFPRCCQLYSSVNHCLYQDFILGQVLSVDNPEAAVSWGETYTGQVAGSSGHAWLKGFYLFPPWIFPVLSSLQTTTFLVWGQREWWTGLFSRSSWLLWLHLSPAEIWQVESWLF